MGWNIKTLTESGYEQQPDGSWRKPDPANPGNRERPVIQKHEENHPPAKRTPKPNHRPKEKAMDERCGGPVRIAITWRVSDKRRRDAWGMAETIADCMVAAFGRLVASPTAGKSGRGKRA
jgi:hypothetical protein